MEIGETLQNSLEAQFFYTMKYFPVVYTSVARSIHKCRINFIQKCLCIQLS